MRLDVDRAMLDVYEFKKEMEAFMACAKGVGNSGSYRELAEYITLEVILKLMKMGQAEKCKPIKTFLPEKLAQVLNQVTNFENRLL